MNKNGLPGLVALFVAALIFTAALQTPAKDGTVADMLQTEFAQMVNTVGTGLVLTMIYLGFMWDLALKCVGIVMAFLFALSLLVCLAAWRIGIFKNEPEKPAF